MCFGLYAEIKGQPGLSVLTSHCLKVSLYFRFCFPGQLACEAPGFSVSTSHLTIGWWVLQVHSTSDRVDPGYLSSGPHISERALSPHRATFQPTFVCPVLLTLCREKTHFCKVLFLLFTKKHRDANAEGKLHNSFGHNIKGVGFFSGLSQLPPPPPNTH